MSVRWGDAVLGGFLEQLRRAARVRPNERRLCCPRCGGDIYVNGGEGCAYTGARLPVYWCDACPWTTTTLSELARKADE